MCQTSPARAPGSPAAQPPALPPAPPPSVSLSVPLSVRPSAWPSVLRDRLCGGFSAVDVAVAVSVAPPQYLAAVLTGLDVAKGRDEAVALAGFVGGAYHRPRRLGAVSEAERRRYPPDGDRDRWVDAGPPGHINFPGRHAVAGFPIVLGRSQEVDR